VLKLIERLKGKEAMDYPCFIYGPFTWRNGFCEGQGDRFLVPPFIWNGNRSNDVVGMKSL